MRAPMPSTLASLRLEYTREPDVSAVLDRELRELLGGCFNQPWQAFFRERRYAQEMPLHRYLLRAPDGRLVAHAAVHEKRIRVGGAELMTGGVAEVCVHASRRGLGLVRHLLERAHSGLVERGIKHALLFGEAAIYASLGYRGLDVEIRRLDVGTQAHETGKMADLLHLALTDEPWPAGAIDLLGPLF